MSNIKLEKDHSILINGVKTSGILFAIIVMLQANIPSVLNIDTKWLIFSCLPVLVALIAGGYIKSFEGLGVKIEASVNEVMDDVAGSSVDAGPKTEVTMIRGNNNYAKLVFYYGRKGYKPDDVKNILFSSEQLEYLEVRENNGDFVCVIPVNEFYTFGKEADMQKIEMFVKAVDLGNVASVFVGKAVTLSIKENENMMAVYKKLRFARESRAAVLSAGKQIIGIVEIASIEKRIAEEIA